MHFDLPSILRSNLSLRQPYFVVLVPIRYIFVSPFVREISPTQGVLSIWIESLAWAISSGLCDIMVYRSTGRGLTFRTAGS